jgi:hypothetical protein
MPTYLPQVLAAEKRTSPAAACGQTARTRPRLHVQSSNRASSEIDVIAAGIGLLSRWAVSLGRHVEFHWASFKSIFEPEGSATTPNQANATRDVGWSTTTETQAEAAVASRV